MDRVALTHEKFLEFVNWSEKHALKQVQAARVSKLEKMGVKNVDVNGRGKKSIYTFSIPDGFWSFVLIQSMSYTEIGVDYINHLIEGRNLKDKGPSGIVSFSSEIYKQLSNQYGDEYKSVESTCDRIKKSLKENDYVRTDLVLPKTHRVKKEGQWVNGEHALFYDHQARTIWTEFFQRELAIYKELHPAASKVPPYIYSAKVKKLYQSDIARWMEVDYYRVAKQALVTDKMLTDIEYARSTFLETHNMKMVRTELSQRQEQYRIEKKLRQEQKKLMDEQEQATIPSLEERRDIQKRLKEIALKVDIPSKQLSQQEYNERETAIAAALDMTLEELHAMDKEEND